MCKVENLSVGMEVKNYRKMCELLGENIKSGNAKIYQLKEWNCHFSYEKLGNKFIINDILDEPLTKNSRGGCRYYREENKLINCDKSIYDLIHDFDGKKDLTSFSSIIISSNCDNCGRIIKDKCSKIVKARGLCARCSLSKGARIIYDYLELNKIKFKKEYTFEKLKGLNGGNLRFDFAIIENEKVHVLIEYDGEYHDKEEFKTLAIHDSLKNDYCKENNIELIRVHNSFDVEKYISEELHACGYNMLEDYKDNARRRMIEEEIYQYQNKINKLNKELENLK